MTVGERARQRRKRRLKEELWEAAYDLAELGVNRKEIVRTAQRGHERFHENMAEYGDKKSVPISARCR